MVLSCAKCHRNSALLSVIGTELWCSALLSVIGTELWCSAQLGVIGIQLC